MAQPTFSPGVLVRYRDRRWIVLPSQAPELTLLKPLGGSEYEITGVHRDLDFEGEEIRPDIFPVPEPEETGSFFTARLLYNAAKLSFRNASGPFRCMGKLSFRPRAYQIVPLVMALKQEVTRLMIADDVGIGKTIEALLILKELMERGEIHNFAIICPPHLCEQWQSELKDKLDISADIIRSSTAASLDRKLPDDRSIFYHLPHQVISIDYLKSDRRKKMFLQDCPALVIVDEAHTCAMPENAKSRKQQLRHALLHEISSKQEQHLLLLTATPHSGKDDEFVSLLGLLNPDFSKLNFDEVSAKQRKQIARYFIQRKRQNVTRWLDEPGLFPERDAKEIAYTLHPEYFETYNKILAFARGLTTNEGSKGAARIRYWAALALLRGVMSSPAAGAEMLMNRRQRVLEQEELEATDNMPNPVVTSDNHDSDFTQAELLDSAGLKQSEARRLTEMAKSLQQLFGFEKDFKLKQAASVVKDWLRQGHQTIIYCKYIPTAKYVGQHLAEILPKKVEIKVVTSELADEQRREQVEQLGKAKQRVLVATDCLSEGINLQEYFTAVLHYDLPWNPNRLEQREGRVDRFGQTGVPGTDKNEVKAYILYGQDNPIDTNVLNVLIRKVHNIQQSIGVSINLGEEGESIMDAVFQEVLFGSKDGNQMSLFAEDHYTNKVKQAKDRARKLRSIFAHETISRDEIQHNLNEIDEAIGDVNTVEDFVCSVLPLLGAQIEADGTGYRASIQNLPAHLKTHFDDQQVGFISFDSPTPKGYRYIGRNHAFIEHLCQFVLSLAFDGHQEYSRVARVSEIMTTAVEKRTILIMFRVRNVIKEVRGKNQVVSEEMYLWGYAGTGAQRHYLDFETAKRLLYETKSDIGLPIERQQADVKRVLSELEDMDEDFKAVAAERAEHLVEAHGRFKELVGGRRYETVTPVLPPDVLGLYVLLPVPASARS